MHIGVCAYVWVGEGGGLLVCVFALNLSSVLSPALGEFCPAVNMMTQAWRFMRH